MVIKELFKSLKEPLSLVRLNIERIKSNESKFDVTRDSFLNAITGLIETAEAEEKFLEANIVTDHLVIAFFGETNAGKSTIIETFRILFNEKTRLEALKKAKRTCEENNVTGVDGLIVGNGTRDFTQTYDEYDMEIDGKQFTLIDVPGIEGDEELFRDGIKRSLQKAHCVFYVHGHAVKPNTKSAEKIKEYLNDWVNVYSVCNWQGGASNYDEQEERECLVTDDVKRSVSLISDVFQQALGTHYGGNITVQGLLALCSKATFAPTRPDLSATQEELIEYFESPDTIYDFSHFAELVDKVRRMSVTYKDLIDKSNRQKVVALSKKIVRKINERISQQKDAVNDLETKLKNFDSQVKASVSQAKSNVRFDDVVESMFDNLRYKLYSAVENEENEDEIKSLVEKEVKYIKRELPKRIGRKYNGIIKKLALAVDRHKRDLNASIKLNDVNVNFTLTNINIKTEEITSALDFDLGGSLTSALSVAMIAWAIPGVGWILGGIFTAVAFFWGGKSKDEKIAEAKNKIDEQIDEIINEVCIIVDDQIVDFKRKLSNVSTAVHKQVVKELKNIESLRTDIEYLKDEMKTIQSLFK